MNISLIRAGKIVAEWPVWEVIRSEDQNPQGGRAWRPLA